MIGVLNAQRPLISMHRFNKKLSYLTKPLIGLNRFFDDFVINISDITYIIDFQARGPQPTLDHIKAHQHARVSKVAIVINRHAADIQAGKTSPQRGKGTLRA